MQYDYITPDDSNPNLIRTTGTTFGWQQGRGSDPDDNGEFAYGGTSENNPENYIALPKEFVEKGLIQPGQSITVRNPNTGAEARGILRDKGTAYGGIDMAPSLAQQLGVNGKGTVDFDLGTVGNDNENVPPNTMSAVQQYLSQQFPQYASTNAPSAGVMSTDTLAADGQQTDQAINNIGVQGAASPDQVVNQNAPANSTNAQPLGQITQYKDGTLDFGGGIIKYPNGVIQINSGQAIHQYVPDSNSPSGYKMTTHYVNQATGAAPPPIPDGMSAQDALKQLPAGDQIIAQKYANYELPGTSRYGKLNPDFQRLLPYVQKLNPNIDPRNYQIQQQTMQQYASQAPTAPGRAISAANQALKHLGLLYDINQELGGSNFPTAQAAENWIKDHLGQKSVNDFRIVRTTMATEIARSLQQGVPTVDQIREWQKNIDENLGDAQRRSALTRDIPGVLEGQLETYDQGWKKVMGTDYDKDKLIDPVTQNALRKIGITNYAGRDIRTPSNSQSVPAPKDYIPNKIYSGTLNGQPTQQRFMGYDQNGKPQWQPVQ